MCPRRLHAGPRRACRHPRSLSSRWWIPAILPLHAACHPTPPQWLLRRTVRRKTCASAPSTVFTTPRAAKRRAQDTFHVPAPALRRAGTRRSAPRVRPSPLFIEQMADSPHPSPPRCLPSDAASAATTSDSEEDDRRVSAFHVLPNPDRHARAPDGHHLQPPAAASVASYGSSTLSAPSSVSSRKKAKADARPLLSRHRVPRLECAVELPDAGEDEEIGEVFATPRAPPPPPQRPQSPVWATTPITPPPNGSSIPPPPKCWRPRAARRAA